MTVRIERGAASPLVVAMAFDSGYCAPAAALVRSCLLAHRRGELQLELVHDRSLSPADLERLEEMCRDGGAGVRFHLVGEEQLGGLPRVDRFGPIVWARVLLPDLLPDARRAIYLDCDTLVLSSLQALWSVDLDGCALGAVANVVEPASREHVRSLGLRYPGGFFNSGVLVLDLERMRQEGKTKEMVGFVRAHAESLVWPDQDALNVVFSRRWCPLPPKWNAQNSLWSWPGWAAEVFGPQELAEAMRDPAVRHFEGPSVAKPWHYLCPVPHRELYRRMLFQTPWAGQPLYDRTAVTMVISRLPRRWRLGAYRRVTQAREALRVPPKIEVRAHEPA
jgi:lipopolysaccharide biosynthesis glycosyltransferase